MHSRAGLLEALGIAATIVFSAGTAVAGTFDGSLVLLVRDDAALETAGPFAYVDGDGLRWEVPVGSVTDGASVPRVLWGFLPPLHGKYLKAAVVHDYNCDVREQPWRRVHEIFFEAMIDAGVDEATAKIMYAAVYAFGPRWSDDRSSLPRRARSDSEKQMALQGLELWIEENDPTIEEIRQRVDADGL